MSDPASCLSVEHKGKWESRKGAERAKGPRPVEAERADAGQKSEDPCGAGRAAAGQNACAAAGQRACTAARPAGVWRPRSPTSMGRPMGPASMGRPMGGASMGQPNKQAPCGSGPRPPRRAHGWPAAGPVRKRPEAAPQSARVACRWARAEAARGRPTERMSGLPPGRWQNRLRPPPARTWDGAWAPSCAATCLPYCPARLPAPHPLYSGTSGASSASSASRSAACSRWKRAWRTRRSACKSGSCTYADR